MDLPYVGDELSMTIMLPDAGRFSEFEDALDASLVDRTILALWFRRVTLDLPKFEFESRFLLRETLKSMGMSDAFDSAASDFSGIDGQSCLAGDPECLYIREVVHKAFVSVDEAGTEAAAATAVVMQQESAPPSPVSVTVDRPFIFLIRGPGDRGRPVRGARDADMKTITEGANTLEAMLTTPETKEETWG